MDLSKLTVELPKLITIIIGGGIAFLGSLVLSWYNKRNNQNIVISSKFERIYSLCQEIYDRHKCEINNALSKLPESPNEFLISRNHPGKESSELKMLIKSYCPELKHLINDFDKGHTPLKESFIELENNIIAGKKIDQELLDASAKEWKEKLHLLGLASDQIKNKIASKLQNLLNIH